MPNMSQYSMPNDTKPNLPPPPTSAYPVQTDISQHHGVNSSYNILYSNPPYQMSQVPTYQMQQMGMYQEKQ